MAVTAVCKGGTVVVGNCRHCRAIAQNRTAQKQEVPFLPPGAWIVQNPGIGESGGVSSGAPQPARHRWSFLRGLQPRLEISGQWFRNHGEYRAFIFHRQSDGKPLGLVEADVDKNAPYVFDATRPDWLVVAQYNKGQLRPAVRPPELMRVVYHNNSWQTRVQGLLS